MTVVVCGCLAGAGLTFLAARQVWVVRVSVRQPPLSPLRETFSGADFVPWLPAVALVALASGLAILATRRASRLAVVAVAMVSGVALVAGAGYGLLAALNGGPGVVPGWPVACLLGGVVVTAAALFGIRYGRDWPLMGARYERSAPRPVSEGHQDPVRLWDALDAGVDPTQRPAATSPDQPAES